MNLKTFLAAASLFLAGCQSVAPSVLNTNDWRYATDPHGSKAIIDGELVTSERVAIAFDRVPRVDKQNNSWVELIYDIPTGSLVGSKGFEVRYQSDKPMVIKLSQKEYGGEGDKSYAHYQVLLPATTEWQTRHVLLSDFKRPDWTPAWSKDKGIVKESVSALYFVPDLTDAEGGKAWLKIAHVELN